MSSSTKTILVIDDDRDMIESIKIMLETAGFEVITAEDGHAGFETALSNRPDLILCDMMMETVDAGAKVAGKIKDKLPEVPIYLLSSIGDTTNYNLDTSELGFSGVLQKPVMPSRLIPLIKKKLDIE